MEAVCRIEPAPSGEPRPQDQQGPQGAPLPAYLHIADTIAERLASGIYQAGMRLPSESQFCAEFGVSHMTLRRALNLLSEKGLISAEKGRGTFARAFDLGDSVFWLRRLMNECPDSPVEVRPLSASTTAASSEVAAMLAIPPGAPTVYLRHLVLKDDIPAIYHREYVPSDPKRPLVELLAQSTSLHGLLNATGGERFPRGRVTLRATALGPTAAKLLDELPGAPALCVEHLFQDAGRRPVSWGAFLLRADLFELQSYLGPEQSDTGIRPNADRRYEK